MTALLRFLRPDVRARAVLYPDRASWLADRLGYLGGSEIAAVLGRSVYRASPFDVWRRKVRPHELLERAPEPEYLEWGQRLEPVILQKFADRHPGQRIFTAGLLSVAHPVYERIRATIDAGGLDLHEDHLEFVVDAKNLGGHAAVHLGPEGTDEIPDDYIVQGTVYCECLDVEACHFAILLGGNRYREYVVARNPGLAETLCVRALDWWADHVETREPPALDGSAQAEAFLRELYPRHELPMLPATDIALQHARAARAAQREADKHLEVSNYHRNILRQMIGAHEGIEGVATNRSSTLKKPVIDWQSVALDLGKTAPRRLDAALNRYTLKRAGEPGSRSLRLLVED